MRDHAVPMNSTSLDLEGLWVPLVTPFSVDDRVDLDALARIGQRVLREGARGLVALGTTGEPAVLDDDEQRQIIDVCATVCRENDGLLMVGTGTNSTATTVAKTNALSDVPGVVAALVVSPYYTRPSAAGIVEHYRVVAGQSRVPIVAYNVPYRTGRELGAAELLTIAAIENVVGLKQAVGCFDTDTLEVLRSAPTGFHVFAGDDAFIAPTMLMGGAGAITASAHVCTGAFAALVRAGRQGDSRRARALAEMLLPIVVAGFAEPNPAMWKGALHAIGEIATPDLRAPMTAASDTAIEALVAAIVATDTDQRFCSVRE